MNSYSNPTADPGRVCKDPAAFTLIELLVVVATLAMLAALFLPAFAAARADVWGAQCRNNLKQIGTGFRLFEQDHDEMFPPAGVQGNPGQLAWDTYIHRYIGGTNSDYFLTNGWLPIESSPRVEYCPSDAPGRNVKMTWIGNPPWNGLRSYAMVACGNDYQAHWQVDTKSGTYPLPTPVMGVGIYWRNAPTDGWDAKSYKTSVVKDPAGAALIVEEPDSEDAAGFLWPCISIGPVAPQGSPWPDLYQLDPLHPLQSFNNHVSEGWATYTAHLNRFNYLFHDNHVEAFSIEKTIGLGTTNNPQGIWTIAPGD